MHASDPHVSGGAPDDRQHLRAPIDAWLRPFARFLRIESASGVVLLLCTAAALVLANSAWAHAYHDFWKTEFGFTLGSFQWSKSLHWWVDDGLMTIFFFVVGLEIKRELVAGELRDARKAALPVVAALGGMIAPAGIYLALQYGEPGARGWGIPMATDIAFVVGILALLGKRVPLGLKIMLLTLAIADDIGAVIVIALFYSTNVSGAMLGLVAAGLAFTVLLRWAGVRSTYIYVMVGAAIWLAAMNSGVHPTVAGVALGLLTPASPWTPLAALRDIAGAMHRRLQQDSDDALESRDRTLVDDMEFAALESIAPVERLERAVHPWVAFLIMPLFALANAGVAIAPGEFRQPISLAVAAGLVFGKPLGIVALSWLAVQLRVAQLPSGVNWMVMLAAGCLAGIGFTMSLFIANLALSEEALEAGKLGTLSGSAISACLGCALLLAFLPPAAAHDGNRVRIAHD